MSHVKQDVTVHRACRYGLSSKDVPPASINAVFIQHGFENPCVIIEHPIAEEPLMLASSTMLPIIASSRRTYHSRHGKGTNESQKISSRQNIWGFGSDGTVGANKNSIKIIGGQHGYCEYAYAHFEYDTEIGVTKSHLRYLARIRSGLRTISNRHVGSTVACHKQAYKMGTYDIVSEIRTAASSCSTAAGIKTTSPTSSAIK